MITLPLAQLRKTQESTMCHECTIEAYTVGGDGTVTYGRPVRGVKCGFKELSGNVSDGTVYETIQADAEMRLPVDVRIGMKDRVTLTKSFDKKVSPVRRFEVSRLPDSFGPSGQVVELTEIYS